MSVNIRHPITPIRQPSGSNLCWAAAIAMVQGGGRGVQSVVSAAQSRGAPLSPDGSLSNASPSAIQALAASLGMYARDVRSTSLTVPILTTAMQSRSAAILGQFAYPGAGGVATLHAVCAFSLVGGGQESNTRLGYVDPYRQGTAENTLQWVLDNFIIDPHFVIS